MTQDELRAALLLAGFITGSRKRYWRRYRKHNVISVAFEGHDVVVYYRAPAIDPMETKEFRSSFQTAFNFIKEKLI